MKATVIGINETNFTDRDNKPQHYVKYHLSVDTGEIKDGKEALTCSHNVLQDGAAPDLKVGDKINVRYGKNSKIIIEGKSA